MPISRREFLRDGVLAAAGAAYAFTSVPSLRAYPLDGVMGTGARGDVVMEKLKQSAEFLRNFSL